MHFRNLIIVCLLVFFSTINYFLFEMGRFKVNRLPANNYSESESLVFLDKRTANWLTTSISSHHDGSTKCLSCHTTLSYSIVRPEYGETDELKLIRSMIEERIKEFEVNGVTGAWYRRFTRGSLSTETIINAVSLMSMDASSTKVGNKISPITEQALRQMWSMQLTAGDLAGGFEWLEGYNLEPLESKNAGYWASSLVLSYLNDIPGYMTRTEVRDNVERLKAYLTANFETQNLHNKLLAIETNWKLGGSILQENQVRATLEAVEALAEEEGGWDLHKLVGSALPTTGKPDSYATSIVIKAFLTTNHTENLNFKKGLNWLRGQQISLGQTNTPRFSGGEGDCVSLVGAFLGTSVNHGGRSSLFMTDLATAFSIKALSMAKRAGF